MKKLYITQKVFKITDHYPILNANQETVYQVDQDFKLIGNTVHVKDDNDRALFTVNKEVFTILPKYDVAFTDGRSITLKSRFTLFKKAIDVHMDGHNLLLEGDFFDYNFRLLDNGHIVGSIEKAFLAWGDTYEITVHDESKEEMLVAIMIAVDCIKDSEQNRNN